MAKKSLFVGMLAIALALGLVLAGCSGSSALVGKWVPESGGSTLELLKDGIGITGNQSFTWVAQKGRLIITQGTNVAAWDYTVSGSILTLTDDNGRSQTLKKE
jgi:hypothetical protein